MFNLQKFKGNITKEVIADRTLGLKFESAIEAVATSSILKEVAETLRKTYEPELETSGEFRGVKVSLIPSVKYEVDDPSLTDLKAAVVDAELALDIAKKRLKLRQDELILAGQATELHYNLLRVTIPKT